MSNRLDFKGDGFSREPFTDEELAAQRERNRHYDENFLSSDDFVKKMGLTWLVNMAKGVPAFIKMFTAVSVVLGSIIAAAKLGVF